MRSYLQEGQAAALALPNRGPLRFTESGALAEEIRAAYSKYGFYVFENVLSAEELEDIKADLDTMRAQFPTGPESQVNAAGEPAFPRLAGLSAVPGGGGAVRRLDLRGRGLGMGCRGGRPDPGRGGGGGVRRRGRAPGLQPAGAPAGRPDRRRDPGLHAPAAAARIHAGSNPQRGVATRALPLVLSATRARPLVHCRSCSASSSRCSPRACAARRATAAARRRTTA